jgi:hypothetical protein
MVRLGSFTLKVFCLAAASESGMECGLIAAEGMA